MMRLLALILVLATSALAGEYPPIKVSGKVNGNEVFECYLRETLTAENEMYTGRRKDDLCKNFPHNLEKMSGVNLSVDLVGLTTIDAFQNFAKKYGSSIKLLQWSNWGEYNPVLQDFMNVFNFVPNVERLEMEGWLKEFTVTGEGTFQLNNLKTLLLKDNHNKIIDLFVNHLPENILHEFSFEMRKESFSSDLFTKFVNKQKKIETLDILGFSPTLADNLSALVLKKATLNFNYNKDYDDQKAFLTAFIAAQPQIAELKLLGPEFYHKHIDDDLFTKICKLQKLSALDFPVDGISETTVRELLNLKNIKSLFVKSNDYKIQGKFNELSLLKLSTLESLKIYVPGYSLPDKFYEQASQNFPSLKSLEIQLGSKQKLNFFMNTFPELESLTVRFGQSNVKVFFDETFEIDSLKHQKMKKLDLMFTHEGEPIDTEKFNALLKAFPNLESLTIGAKFPFCEEFLTALKGSLGNIKELSLGSFIVPCNEDFAINKLNALKEFNTRMESFSLTLSTVVEHFMQGFKGDSCLFYENGEFTRKSLTKHMSFSFEPLVQELKNDFTITYDDYANVRTVYSVGLKGGKSNLHKF